MACPDCFKGFERTDKAPSGSVSTIHGLPTYVAQPPSSAPGPTKGIIVIIPDAFGWEFINNRILADTYAAAGFRVYLPDFMAGVPAPLYLLDSMMRLTSAQTWWDTACKPWDLFWILRGMVPFMWTNWPSFSHPRVVAFLEKLRTTGGSGSGSGSADQGLKIGVAGFCWGGKHAVLLTHQAEAHLIDSAFTAHPSFLSFPADIDAVRMPLSIAVGDKDNMMNVEQIKQTEATLKKMDGVKGEVVVYPGAGHGFSVRIDAKNPKQVEQSQEAETQAVKWFEETLK